MGQILTVLFRLNYQGTEVKNEKGIKNPERSFIEDFWSFKGIAQP